MLFFHSLGSQIAGLIDVKKDLNIKEDKRVVLCAKIEKLSIVIKKVTVSEITLTHKAKRPNNYISSSFTHYQAEQIKKGVICVPVLLEIH